MALYNNCITIFFYFLTASLALSITTDTKEASTSYKDSSTNAMSTSKEVATISSDTKIGDKLAETEASTSSDTLSTTDATTNTEAVPSTKAATSYKVSSTNEAAYLKTFTSGIEDTTLIIIKESTSTESVSTSGGMLSFLVSAPSHEVFSSSLPTFLDF